MCTSMSGRKREKEDSGGFGRRAYAADSMCICACWEGGQCHSASWSPGKCVEESSSR